jgi:glycosyltransferase involved in cell wall biosynthesis
MQTSKILFICTEDWFFHSHFLPLIEAGKHISNSELVLVTTTRDKYRDIERLGVRIISVDFNRASMAGLSAIKLAFRLARVFRRERPDLIHFIALKPIVVGGFASRLVVNSATAFHLTGQGFFSVSDNASHRWLKALFMRLLLRYLRRQSSWLFLENKDDGDMLAQFGSVPEKRTTILGGAGVNPGHFPALAIPDNRPIKMGFVGRMVWTKGVDTLADALQIVNADGVKAVVDLYGEPDLQNPRTISLDQLAEWDQRPDMNWHGRSNNIVDVWKTADIAVVPSRGGEGMPRSMLEAACCARALIVTDVPGCHHFVRDGIEGIIVPPDDSEALARAIGRLLADKNLRHAMAKAARQRVLTGFTESHVINDVTDVYKLLTRSS